MRNIHKDRVIKTLEANLFAKIDFRYHEQDDYFSLMFKLNEKLRFSFIHSEEENDSYSTNYVRYNRKYTEVTTDYKHISTAIEIFVNWLSKDVQEFISDYETGDPFNETAENEKIFEFFQKENRNTIDENDNAKLSEIESIIFESNLDKLQLFIESKFVLQSEQLQKITEDIKLLKEASKTETKSIIKLAVKKFFSDLFLKVVKDGIIEGAKYFIDFLNQLPVKELPPPEQFFNT